MLAAIKKPEGLNITYVIQNNTMGKMIIRLSEKQHKDIKVSAIKANTNISMLVRKILKDAKVM